MPWTHRNRQAKNYRQLFAEVEARDGLVCRWCDKPVVKVPRGHDGRLNDDHATLDHLVPRSACGPDTPENMLMSCYRCNQDRGKRQNRSGTAGYLTEAELVKLMNCPRRLAV